MKVYDNYEISPCKRYEEPHTTGKFYFEVCEPHEADVWTLYGHLDGEGVEAIGDFSTREHAAEIYSRITGLPFTGSYQADARLRMMHAAPDLLDAAEVALNRLEWVLDSVSQALGYLNTDDLPQEAIELLDEVTTSEYFRDDIEKVKAIIAKATHQDCDWR
jgi:hypothetical protein